MLTEVYFDELVNLQISLDLAKQSATPTMGGDDSRGPSRQSVKWDDVDQEGDIPGQEASEHVKAPPANPFTMPNDEEIFLLRDQERERKKSEREARQNQKIWEKGTWTTRISVPRRALLEDAEGVDGSKTKIKARGASGGDAAGGRRREKVLRALTHAGRKSHIKAHARTNTPRLQSDRLFRVRKT